MPVVQLAGVIQPEFFAKYMAEDSPVLIGFGAPIFGLRYRSGPTVLAASSPCADFGRSPPKVI